MEAVDADAALVVARPNVRYLTGFTGSSGWALLVDGQLHLLTDERYRTQARDESPYVELHIGNEGLVSMAAAILGDAVRELEIDSAALTVAAAEQLRQAVPAARMVPTAGRIERLRARKAPEEIGAIEAALELTEQALVEAFSVDVRGRTERALAARLEYACRRLGADAMAFETIVASGPRGARPHARPGDSAVPESAPVVVDCGCVVDGYCSDITRTVVVGEMSARWQRIHDAVDRARAAAIAAARPGIPAAELDGVARAVLAEEGLDRHFVHSLGHGVGLEVHEAPRLSSRSEEILEEGMVVTIEPGVYLPGEGGVRLEDLVVIEQGGARRLNRLGTRPLRPLV